MRFSLAILIATVASATASTLQARQLPACSGPCLIGPDVDTGSCSATDNACLCRNEAFITKSTACIVDACTGDDLDTALAAAQALCKSVGVTLSGSVPTKTDTDTASETQTGTDTTSAPTATSPPASSNTSTGTSTGTAPNSSQTGNSASTVTMNAFAGLAAFGLAALAL
ncbi:hypothetical protein Hypma_001870 [Hypsizygus marmoreus]|uniref:CFEM domain-containing protein n=1 Tax=Hypsizygus marmoreus TaxID=39966 RepID=A0A369J5B2_HYPMA|nr:hypothetical protein Hypma_001870 [Hypsizygus marmoreus]